MTKTIQAYWRVLSEFHSASLVCLALLLLAGLSEGLALMVLIPVLNHAMGKEAGLPLWDGLINMLGLSGSAALPLGIGLFLVLGLATAMAALLADLRRVRIRAEVERVYKTRIASALLRMCWTPYSQIKAGDVHEAVMLDGVQVASGVYLFILALGNMLVAAAFVLIALCISPWATAVTAAFGLLTVTAMRIISRRSTPLAHALNRMGLELNINVMEYFTNLKYIRASGSQPATENLITKLFRRYHDTYLRFHMREPFVRLISEGGAIVFLAALLTVNLTVGTESVANTLVFLAVFYRLLPRVRAINDLLHQAKGYQPWLENHDRRMSLAMAHQDYYPGTRRPTLDHGLRLEAVHFSYEGRTVIQTLTQDIRRGDFVLLAGPSGSGKSTLIDLITGVLSPQQGDILIDGISLREQDIWQWRNMISIVQQDNPIFHASVLENIAWGEDAPDRDRAIAACRQASAWDFVSALPNGLDEVLGERGARLSGGQRQRIAMARALYKRPQLIILDEPTSSLDSETEQGVLETLSQLRGTCTVIMASHSSKALPLANTIIQLDEVDAAATATGRGDDHE